MYTYIYPCIYIYMYVYICICICIYIYTYIGVEHHLEHHVELDTYTHTLFSIKWTRARQKRGTRVRDRETGIEVHLVLNETGPLQLRWLRDIPSICLCICAHTQPPPPPHTNIKTQTHTKTRTHVHFSNIFFMKRAQSG